MRRLASLALVAFLLVRRRRVFAREDAAAPAPQLVTDEATSISLVVASAQAQLDSQLASDDALDLKALGILGADAVAIGVLVAANAVVP